MIYIVKDELKCPLLMAENEYSFSNIEYLKNIPVQNDNRGIESIRYNIYKTRNESLSAFIQSLFMSGAEDINGILECSPPQYIDIISVSSADLMKSSIPHKMKDLITSINADREKD